MPVHPNSLKNLKPIPPGVSGNPGGRPKGSSILAPLLKKLAADPDENGHGKEAREYAELLLRQSRVVATGVPRDEHYDLGPIFKLLDRTDPEVKESKVYITDNGTVTPGVDE